MDSEKKQWVILAGVSAVAAIGLGVLIYSQRNTIAEHREKAEQVRTEIASARKLIKTTPDLVREVIIQRETDATIKETLSDQEDVNNFVRTLREFEVESGCSISQVRKQPDKTKGRKTKEAFGRVKYTLQLEADVFQFLTFISRVESHSRLMSVADFKLTGARRQEYDGEAEPRHRITLDIETYVYESATTAQPVRIDNYDRKRDLLVSEISKRTSELRVPAYEYHGAKGRRDPWVDPRIPVNEGAEGTLSIEEQIAIVEQLTEQADELESLWLRVESAENLISELKARSDLEASMVRLEEEIRKVKAGGQLNFAPAARRMDRKVVAVLEELRGRLDSVEGRGQGPTLTALREVQEAMQRLTDGGQYELALETLADLEPRLPMAERDPRKKPLVDELYGMKRMLETVLDFEKIQLEIQGIAIYEDRRPVALINGVAVSEGELIDEQLLVQRITIDQVEFGFRGVRVARQLDEFMNRTARN